MVNITLLTWKFDSEYIPKPENFKKIVVLSILCLAVVSIVKFTKICSYRYIISCSIYLGKLFKVLGFPKSFLSWKNGKCRCVRPQIRLGSAERCRYLAVDVIFDVRALFALNNSVFSVMLQTFTIECQSYSSSLLLNTDYLVSYCAELCFSFTAITKSYVAVLLRLYPGGYFNRLGQ